MEGLHSPVPLSIEEMPPDDSVEPFVAPAGDSLLCLDGGPCEPTGDSQCGGCGG